MRKLYEFRLLETNGEQEYSYDHACFAESIEEANRIAEAYAKQFYGPPVEVEWEEGEKVTQYHFMGGRIVVEVEFVRQTNVSNFMNRLFDLALVKAETLELEDEDEPQEAPAP